MNQEYIQYCIPENIASGIYKIVAPDGSYYIGSAVLLKRRCKAHIKTLLANKHCNPVMQNKFNKHSSGWKFELVEEVKNNTLILEVEQKYVDSFFNTPGCMNCNPKVNSYPRKNTLLQHFLPKKPRAKRPYRPLTEEHKKALSLAKIGKVLGPHSKEWNDNISKSQKGKKLPPEVIAKRQATRAANKGFKRSKESVTRQIETRRQKGWFVDNRVSSQDISNNDLLTN